MSKAAVRTMLAATVAGCMLCGGQWAAEVYKTVDDNGNVVYTDRPPAENAQPMELPGLSVIEAIRPASGDRAETAAAGEQGDQEAVTSIRELRRGYRDFALVSPVAEETYWGTGGQVPLAWETRYQLQPGMKVVFYVDGEARQSTTAEAITVDRLERGAHTAYAELLDARNRKIATAKPVTFYIQQYSINYGSRRQVRPGPG